IPSRFAPYIGAGGGAMWYQFKQDGDFVDFKTHDVFTNTFESAAWAPVVHGFGGMDFSLTPHLALMGEGKYAWAKADLSNAFAGYQKIDLSGFSATFGILVRF